MIQLIKLEFKKNRISRYIRNVIIMAAALCLFVFAMNYLGLTEDPETGITDAGGSITILVDALTTIAFFIFASAMHATFTMGAYKNKTMELMFTYPIGRRKIIVAKMLSVFLFNYVAFILTQLIMYTSLYIGQFFFQPAFDMNFNLNSIPFLLSLLFKDAMSISISLIALFIGMILKSSKAVVLSCFILITLLQGNVGDITFVNNIAVPIVLTAVSIFFAALSVLRVNQKDII